MVRRSARLAAAAKKKQNIDPNSAATRALAIPEILELILAEALNNCLRKSSLFTTVNKLWNATTKALLFEEISTWNGRTFALCGCCNRFLETTTLFRDDTRNHAMVRSLCLTATCPGDRDFDRAYTAKDADIIAKCDGLRSLFINAGAVYNWKEYRSTVPSTLPNLRFMRLTFLPEPLTGSQEADILALVGSARGLTELYLSYSMRHFEHEENLSAVTNLLRAHGHSLTSLGLDISTESEAIIHHLGQSLSPHIGHLSKLYLAVYDLEEISLLPLMPVNIEHLTLFCHPSVAARFLAALADPAILPNLRSVPQLDRYHEGDVISETMIAAALEGIRQRPGIPSHAIHEDVFDQLRWERSLEDDSFDEDGDGVGW